MKTIDSILTLPKPNNEFLQLIEQERARVNRNGSNFTLVLLQLSDGLNDDKEVQSNVLHTIRQRIRTIDQVGYYDKGHIGLLLPQTSRDGATKMVGDLWRNEKFVANFSSYRLYCYP
jgi:PleD family two-component response regulator